MEIGCDAVLLNSSLAMANKPIMMAKAMKNAVIAGRNAFLAGRMKKSKEAIPTSKKDNFL